MLPINYTKFHLTDCYFILFSVYLAAYCFLFIVIISIDFNLKYSCQV